MRYLQTYSVAQRPYMCLAIYWDIILCGRFGLWPFRSVAVPVCGRSGLWPFRFVAVPVCGRFGCGRSGLWPFRFVAVSVVAVSVCGRYDLLPLLPFTFLNSQSAFIRYLQTYSVAQRPYMCLAIYWDIILCGPFSLWPSWFLAVSVCGRFGLWPFRSVAFPVCGHFSLWPFRFVTVSVCGRYDLLPLLPLTDVMSKQKVKVRGQRSRVTEVMTPFSRFRTVTPVWIHIWWWNDAQSSMLLRRSVLLFIKVIWQIWRSHG